MKVAIVIPSALNSYLKKFTLSYNEAVKYLMENVNDLPYRIDEVREIRPINFPIDANRNMAVAEILNDNFDTSIWVDADQTFPVNAFFKLLNNREFPVISGMYHIKEIPFFPVIFKKLNENGNDFTWHKPVIHYPQKDYFEADMVGMGCIKIDRIVFETIAKSYWDKGEKAEFFRYQENPLNIDYIGEEPTEDQKRYAKICERYLIRDASEDKFFCEQVASHGFKIVIDPMIQSPHINTSFEINKPMSDSYRESIMQRMKEQDPKRYEKGIKKQCRVEAIK